MLVPVVLHCSHVERAGSLCKDTQIMNPFLSCLSLRCIRNAAFLQSYQPLSSCLISLLAVEVVNWLTMSKAVWLYVLRMFTLTPA